MNKLETKSELRREQDILDRLENVKRLIQMEYTLMTSDGANQFTRFYHTDRDGKRFGNDLLHELRDTIQLQLLSIVALCYGGNPDIGEPAPMLEWATDIGCNAEDKFREVWGGCLRWNS